MSDPMTEHHRANILPPRHDRDDYDFDYKDGVPGPIRIGAIVVPDVPINIPAKVWCKRHGWEIEPAPSTEEPS